MNAIMDALRWFNVDRAAVLVAAAALLGLVYAAKSARSANAAAGAARDQADAALDQAKAAREQVDVSRHQTDLLLHQIKQGEEVEMQRRFAEREAMLPAVVVDIRQNRVDPTILTIVIENVGRTPARNVRIKPPAQLLRSDGLKMHEWRVFTETISVMPPGHQMQYFFDVGFARYNGKLPTYFTFTVEADGPFGPLPVATYDVDIAPMNDVWSGETTLNTLVEEIKRTNRGLQDVKEAIRNLDPAYRAWLRRGMEDPPGEPSGDGES